MSYKGSVIRTEIRGLDLRLEHGILSVSSAGQDLISPIGLTAPEAERLALHMSKAELPEWNQLEELKSRAELRYRRYLGSWLVMCLAAFSAYIGYPGYYLCILLSLLSIFLWWRAGFVEQKAARETEAERNAFRPDWNYLRRRREESEAGGATGSSEAE